MSTSGNSQTPRADVGKAVYLKMGGFKGKAEKTVKISYGFFVAGLALVFLVALFYQTDSFLHSKLEYLTQQLSEQTGSSLYITKGALLIFSIPLFLLLATFNAWGILCEIYNWQFSKSSTKALWLVGLCAVYWGLYWIVLGIGSRGAYAYKFCADIPEDVVTSDVAEGNDRVYGRSYHRCTPAEVRFLQSKHGRTPAVSEVQIPDWRHIHWKDAGAGTVVLWYAQRGDGYHFFNHSGTDPEGGVELKPVNQSVVTQYQAEQLKQTTDAQDALLLTQAQKSFESNDFKSAVEACTMVLGHGANEPCDLIKHDASVQWAHLVVDQGQAQLQRGQYDAAIRSAQQAIRLDPDNLPARNLLQVANTLKPQASLD